MTTGKDYGLPEEYADWVETSGLEIHIDTPDYLHLIARRFKHGPLNTGSVISDRYYIPPKPKPTLPDVKPGGIVAYRSKDGESRRAVLFSDGRWLIIFRNSFVGVSALYDPWSDAALLADVNDDGFTVELGGLE